MPPKPTPEQLALRGFVQRLERNFDDTEAWMGYAKLLTAKRDARGELIMRWHEKRDFDAFVAQHAAELFGAAAADVGNDRMFRLAWHMGYVLGITVAVPRGATHDAVQNKLGALLKQPVFMFMQRLHVELLGGGATKGWLEQIRPTSLAYLKEISAKAT
jgi:hypothetical protein